MMFTGECIYLLAQVLFWWSCLLYMTFYFLRLDVSRISKQHSFCFLKKDVVGEWCILLDHVLLGRLQTNYFFFRKFTPVGLSWFQLVWVGFSWFESVSVDWSRFQPTWGDLFESTVVVFSHFKLTSYIFSRLQLVSFVYRRFQLVSEGSLSVNFSHQKKSKLCEKWQIWFFLQIIWRKCKRIFIHRDLRKSAGIYLR